MSQFQFSSRTNQTHPHLCSTSHLLPWIPQVRSKVAQKLWKHAYNGFAERLGKNSSYYYYTFLPQVYPVLRIIYELKGISQAEKPSYMTCSLLKWTSRKIREEISHKYLLIRDFSVVCYTVLSPKNSCTKFTPECQ